MLLSLKRQQTLPEIKAMYDLQHKQ